MSKAYTEALELSLGRVIADARRQVETIKAQSDALIAEMAARLAETETRCLTLEGSLKEAVEARLAALKDGADADPATIERMVIEAVARIPAPKDGKDADPGEVEALRAEIAETKAAVAEIVIPGAPDLSGFATKEALDLLAVDCRQRDEESLSQIGRIDVLSARFDDLVIPEPPDLSSFARKDEVAQVAMAIPEAPDLSGFATKAEVETLRGDIPAAPDLSGFATKDDLERLPAPRDGADVEMEEVARLICEEVAKAVAEIPPAKDGEPGADADMPELLRHVEATVAAAIPPKEELRGPAGRLPTVKAWVDAVHYEGAVVAHDGSLYQASVDTGREPPHADWTCLAARGEDGRSVNVRGTYVDGGEYRYLDIAALNGGSFIALRDNPGACPGEGWQLLAGRGKPGQAIKGDPGPKGDDAPLIVAAHVSDEGILTITSADGTEAKADFYPLLARMVQQ